MKKLIILLPIVLTAGCATPQETQCDPEKNYIISNPELMEKYKEEFKHSEIKSLYYDSSELNINKGKICKESRCVSFDYKNFEFMEKKFNDSYRKGVYSVYSHKKNDNTNKCNFDSNTGDKVCYEVLKNTNDEIKSKYGTFMYEENSAIIVEFKNMKENKLLYKYSYTIYTTGAIGGAGFGICGPKYNNNKDYKFHVLSFPSNPFNIPYKI